MHRDNGGSFVGHTECYILRCTYVGCGWPDATQSRSTRSFWRYILSDISGPW